MNKIDDYFLRTKTWEEADEYARKKGLSSDLFMTYFDPMERVNLYGKIVMRDFHISIPRQQEIPKDNGKMRIVYINDDISRVFLHVMNVVFMHLFGDMIHKNCMSYKTGISTGYVARKTSKDLVDAVAVWDKEEKKKVVVWKSDFTKYFDSVPRPLIMAIFDAMERRYGHSFTLDVVREYYNRDLCYDLEGNLIEQYQSLKQGCAVASFLADAIMYNLDEELSEMNVTYYRYSDDIICFGKDKDKAFKRLVEIVAEMDMTLNPKKVERYSEKEFVTFLGWAMRGSTITLSKKRIRSYCLKVKELCFKGYPSLEVAKNRLKNYLYLGEYPWARGSIAVVNSVPDIICLWLFAYDCLEKVAHRKYKWNCNIGFMKEGNPKYDGVTFCSFNGAVATAHNKLGIIDIPSLCCWKYASRVGRMLLELDM